MRRVWRLGQSNPVTTTFPVYNGTAEAAGLAWMGAKMKAGMVMYGDNAAGALVDESEEDEDDLRREMIRHALQGKSYESVGEVCHLFTSPSQQASLSVPDGVTSMGTGVAARLTIFDLLLAQAQGHIRVDANLTRKPRTAPAGSLQLVMF